MTNDIINGTLITFSQAARMLGITSQALRLRAKMETINAVKIGKLWLVSRKEIEEEMVRKAA